MPRKTRVHLPICPAHMAQRGSYRQNGLGKLEQLITEHQGHQKPGVYRSEKTDYYRVLIRNAMAIKFMGEIGQCPLVKELLGRESFRQRVHGRTWPPL